MDQQFRAALGALFGHDPSQQQAANLWLNDFSRSSEAWGCALALLEPTSGATLEQAFFAANLLANKTREEWVRLSAQQRLELAEAFRSKLRGLLLPSGSTVPSPASVPPVLLDRVALLAAAAAALGGPATAERHLALAQELAATSQLSLEAATEADKAGGVALLRCALLMLQQLAEEAEGLDSVRRKALLAGPDAGGAAGGGGLAARRGGVVSLAREVLTTAAAAAGAPPGPGADAGGPNFVLLLVAARCLSAWVRLDESGCSGGCMSPGELEALCPRLLPSVLSLLSLPPPGPPTSSPLAASAAARQQQQPATALYGVASDLAVDVLGPESRTSTAAADVAATVAALNVLLPLGGQLAEAAAAEAAAEEAAGGGGGGDGGAALAALLGWIRVAVAVSERDAGSLATAGEGAVELAKVVVAALAACPGRRAVAEAVTDYFLALNTVPTAERHPALRAPLYSALLPHVLRAVSYPTVFEDWESAEEDEEAFNRFREQQAAELLESMYGQCRTSMMSLLVAEAVGGAETSSAAAAAATPPSRPGPAGDWRRVEAVVFCVRAVHMPVKAAALGGRVGALDSPEALATAAQLQALLGRLFTDVCSPAGRVAGFLSVPWVCLAVSRLIAEYAAWLGRAEGAPLKESMGLLLRALGVPSAAPAAAQAFRNCCVRGADRLTADSFLLAELAAAAMAVVAPPPPPGGAAAAAVPLGLEERCTVVEGLARLASKLPAEAAAEAGCGLMRPCVERVQSVAAAAAAAGGPLSHATLAALAAELGLMTAVVRFLEQPLPLGGPPPGLPGAGVAAAAQQPHPALRALEVAWPVLSAVAAEPQCQRDPGVVEALAGLYKRSLLATKLGGRPLLRPLLESVGGALRVRPHPALMEVLATCVELFGEVASCGDTRGLQVAALQGCVQMMAALMAHHKQQQQASAAAVSPAPTPPFPGAPSVSAGELAASFFTLLDRVLIFAQKLLLPQGEDEGEAAGALPALVEWAGSVLCTMREREPAAAALSFLNHLLSAAVRSTAAAAAATADGGPGQCGEGGGGAAAARLDRLFGSCGPALVHSLLVAGADTCPRQLLRPLAGCLAGLVALADAGRGGGGGGGGGGSEVWRGLPRWLAVAWQLPPLAELARGGRLGEGGVLALRFTELLLRGRYPPGTATAAATAAAANGLGADAATAVAAAAASGTQPALTRGRLDSLVTDLFAVVRGEAAEDVLLAYEL